MIEAYLRANKLFVDYNEVRVFIYSLYFLIVRGIFASDFLMGVMLTDFP